MFYCGLKVAWTTLSRAGV